MSLITYPTIRFNNVDLLIDVAKTYLTAELTSVGTGLTVESVIGIAAGDYILIGEFGQEKSEVVRVDSVSSPSTITLTAATTFTHERGTVVYRIDRNRVEFSYATTVTGSKSVLATSSILADSLYTIYEDTDTSHATYYGFARANNQADSTFSKYTESYPYAGYVGQTLKIIFDSVLASLGMKDNIGQPKFSNAVTREDAYQAVVDCQEELAGLKKRWSYFTDFNVTISELATGQDSYALPTNIAFENGNAAILAVRIGSQKDMAYIDKAKLNKRRWNVVKTTLGAAITATSDTSITLTDSSDFDDSGSIDVVANDGETFDTIAYTANDRATNIISGVTGIAATKTVDNIVWQGASYGEPTKWTAFEDTIVLDLPPSATWEQFNLLADLYTRPTVVNDLADEAQFPAYVIKPYVAYKLAEIIDNGPSTRSQAFYTRFQEQKASLISSERSGQFVTLKPMRHIDATTNQNRQWFESAEDTNT